MPAAAQFIAVPDTGHVAVCGFWHDCSIEKVEFEVTENPPCVIIRSSRGTWDHWTPPVAGRDVSGLYTDEELAPARAHTRAMNRLKAVINRVRDQVNSPGTAAEITAIQDSIDFLVTNRLAVGDSLILSVDVSPNGNGEIFFVRCKDGLHMLEYGRGCTAPKKPPREVQINGLEVYVRRLVEQLNKGDVICLCETDSWYTPEVKHYTFDAILAIEDAEAILAGRKPKHGILDPDVVANLR